MQDIFIKLNFSLKLEENDIAYEVIYTKTMSFVIYGKNVHSCNKWKKLIRLVDGLQSFRIVILERARDLQNCEGLEKQSFF